MLEIYDSTAVDSNHDEEEMDYLSESSGGDLPGPETMQKLFSFL